MACHQVRVQDPTPRDVEYAETTLCMVPDVANATPTHVSPRDAQSHAPTIRDTRTMMLPYTRMISILPESFMDNIPSISEIPQESLDGSSRFRHCLTQNLVQGKLRKIGASAGLFLF